MYLVLVPLRRVRYSAVDGFSTGYNKLYRLCSVVSVVIQSQDKSLSDCFSNTLYRSLISVFVDLVMISMASQIRRCLTCPATVWTTTGGLRPQVIARPRRKASIPLLPNDSSPPRSRQIPNAQVEKT